MLKNKVADFFNFNNSFERQILNTYSLTDKDDISFLAVIRCRIYDWLAKN